MKTENILKTDLLDIIFLNRNKEYGAYELRKHYSKRLLKSILITTVMAVAFTIIQSWKIPKQTVTIISFLDSMKLIEYVIPKDEVVLKEKKKAILNKSIASANTTKPDIVKSNIIDEPMPTIDEIDTAFSGTKNNKGIASNGIIGEVADDTSSFGKDAKLLNSDSTEQEFLIEEPINNPSINPEYPGGLIALKNFMLRNLHQPENIEEGNKIIVVARFIVDKIGNISDIVILQNGREDLDAEVTRVISKMPKWKPGFQNGIAVSVYFKMPITFINDN